MSLAIKTTRVMAEPTLILLVAGRAPQFSPNSRAINPGVRRGSVCSSARVFQRSVPSLRVTRLSTPQDRSHVSSF